MTQESQKKVLFTIIFGVLALGALQVPLNQLVGSNAKFTLFDSFGPIATGFIGTLPGIIAVFLAQLTNFILHGAQVVDAGTIIRFFPMLFAAWYFAKPRRINILIPILAITAFNLHPIGRSAWYFSLFWLIPIACEFLRDRSLIARALGATFTAHAVGGALWVWTFGLTKEIWTSLIPMVAMERALFATGICLTYLAMNNILAVLDDRKVVDASGLVNQNLVWNKLLSQKA
ncbi:MAG: hypothetical protein AAB410_02290 [Patescibacteria group bacterium]